MNTWPNCELPGGGGAVTVTAAVPLTVSEVAVIVAVPAVTPLTSPLPVTVATAVLLDAQATVRPVSVLPLASLGVAVSWTVWPVDTEADAGVTATEATGTCTTVMAEGPLCPSEVAVIVAAPASFAVTSPLELTVAAAVLLDVQVTTRPDSGFPAASLGVAVSCTVLPSSTLADAGVTATVATGTGGTVILAVPLCPSLVAVIVAPPVATAVTSPLAFTPTTDVLLLDQLTTRPVSGLPFASFGVAVSWTVPPGCRPTAAGVTATDATGAAVTLISAVPLWPSLVAVIVAEPAATLVTSPLAFTVATAGVLLAHVTTRPDSGLPLTSLGVAASCTVWPACIVADPGVTATDATGPRAGLAVS